MGLKPPDHHPIVLKDQQRRRLQMLTAKREQLPMPRNELADYAANKSDRDSKLGTISSETGQGTISIKLVSFQIQKKKNY